MALHAALAVPFAFAVADEQYLHDRPWASACFGVAFRVDLVCRSFALTDEAFASSRARQLCHVASAEAPRRDQHRVLCTGTTATDTALGSDVAQLLMAHWNCRHLPHVVNASRRPTGGTGVFGEANDNAPALPSARRCVRDLRSGPQRTRRQRGVIRAGHGGGARDGVDSGVIALVLDAGSATPRHEQLAAHLRGALPDGPGQQLSATIHVRELCPIRRQLALVARAVCAHFAQPNVARRQRTDFSHLLSRNQ